MYSYRLPLQQFSDFSWASETESAHALEMPMLLGPPHPASDVNFELQGNPLSGLFLARDNAGASSAEQTHTDDLRHYLNAAGGAQSVKGEHCRIMRQFRCCSRRVDARQMRCL